ncbi:MAG: AAA family ATPase [Candidatus Aminicenantes bacterium]|nr:AAA family ATPase [Candidatus Aminicenantes bacterium]
MKKKPVQWLEKIHISGYRCFEKTLFDFKPLVVIAGANGTGKSSLFEFLRFLRDACFYEIPPEIVSGSIGRNIFHKPGPDKFEWSLKTSDWKNSIDYNGELMGPIGNPIISNETIDFINTGQVTHNYLQLKNGKGTIRDPKTGAMKGWSIKKTNQLGLGTIADSSMEGLYNLREYIRSWRFYNAFKIDDEKIRRPAPITQNPLLSEDAGNLSSVLFHLISEYRDSFEQLKSVIKAAIPGFKNINVKARGGPGEVLAFWMEDCIDSELTLADLSDGTLRFITWAVLSVMPSAPTLICIDEPDQGVHPRTLPLLAGLFEKASQRTQFILATHASYFLTQFKVENIAVMKKNKGKSQYIKISDSRALMDNLDDFGTEELELMHRNDEMEGLA